MRDAFTLYALNLLQWRARRRGYKTQTEMAAERALWRAMGQPLPSEPFCCEPGCTKAPEFLVTAERFGGGLAGPDHYMNDYHACTDHVGAMCTFQPGATDTDEVFWRVEQLSRLAVANA